MADNKRLIFAIIDFLNKQKDSRTLPEDAVESLEVVMQCLESAYSISLQDDSGAERYSLPATLEDIFSQGVAHFDRLATQNQQQKQQVSDEQKVQAEKHKAEGNECMKQDKFQEALDCYTKAINLDATNAVYYCNRAAAHSKVNNNKEAIEDCERALAIDPNYSKAFGRKGLAHSALNEHQLAIECYKKALELDPENPSYKQNLDIAEKKSTESDGPAGRMGNGVGPGVGGGRMGGLNLGGLDFSSMLSNPALMNMATNMMQNPQLQQMMAGLLSGSANSSPGSEGSDGMANLLQAGQQLAQQMQQTNPDLVEHLRERMSSDRDGQPDNAS